MGREWNDYLPRRLQDSIVRATEASTVMLVTDLEDSDRTLIEVLSRDERSVVAEFLVTPATRPSKLRYRDEMIATRRVSRPAKDRT